MELGHAPTCVKVRTVVAIAGMESGGLTWNLMSDNAMAARVLLMQYAFPIASQNPPIPLTATFNVCYAEGKVATVACRTVLYRILKEPLPSGQKQIVTTGSIRKSPDLRNMGSATPPNRDTFLRDLLSDHAHPSCSWALVVSRQAVRRIQGLGGGLMSSAKAATRFMSKPIPVSHSTTWPA